MHWSLEDQNCFTVMLALPLKCAAVSVNSTVSTELCDVHHTVTLSHTTQVDTKHCSEVTRIAVSSQRNVDLGPVGGCKEGP
jgi:hypothetical protein